MTTELLPHWPQRTVTLADREFQVREAKSTSRTSEPAVFIHGLGGSSTNWTDLMGLLQGQLHSIAPDLSGFGYSPPPGDGDYTPAGHARGVAALIEREFGDRPVHVFGNSLGGAVSLQLAGRRPDLVKSLTLVSPALPEYLPRLSSAHLPIMAIPGVGRRLFNRFMGSASAERRVQAMFDICYADPTRVPAQRVQEAIADLEARAGFEHAGEAFIASLQGLAATYVDRGPQRPWKLAEQISAPTLLIYGKQDKLVNPRGAHTAMRHFQRASLVVVPDSGHVTQLEHPELVAETWKSFVAASLIPSKDASGAATKE